MQVPPPTQLSQVALVVSVVVWEVIGFCVGTEAVVAIVLVLVTPSVVLLAPTSTQYGDGQDVGPC